MYYRFTFRYGESTPAPTEPGNGPRRNSFAFSNPFTFEGQNANLAPAELGNTHRRNSFADYLPFILRSQETTQGSTGLKRRASYAILNPFKRQKTTLTSAVPGCNSRHILSKELVEEWFNTIHDGFGSRNVATFKIKEVMTPIFTEGDIHTRYDLDVYKKYGSIYTIDNDYSVAAGAKENRPCHNGDSQLHKLRCGHYAYSEYRQTKCGSSCEKSIQEDGQSFFCILCGRNKVSKNKHVGGISRRWHDVLLPESIEPDFEMGKFEDTKMNRQVEPAYLDPHGSILLPCIHCIIAMVRAYEIRAEAELKDHIRRVLSSIMPNDTAVAMVALEYFEHFLALHANFKFADMRVLAACSVHLVLFQSSKLVDPHVMLQEFNPPVREDFRELFQLATDQIHVWASCLMMLVWIASCQTSWVIPSKRKSQVGWIWLTAFGLIVSREPNDQHGLGRTGSVI
jgi:hypothetical protein